METYTSRGTLYEGEVVDVRRWKKGRSSGIGLGSCGRLAQPGEVRHDWHVLLVTKALLMMPLWKHPAIYFSFAVKHLGHLMPSESI